MCARRRFISKAFCIRLSRQTPWALSRHWGENKHGKKWLKILFGSPGSCRMGSTYFIAFCCQFKFCFAICAHLANDPIRTCRICIRCHAEKKWGKKLVFDCLRVRFTSYGTAKIIQSVWKSQYFHSVMNVLCVLSLLEWLRSPEGTEHLTNYIHSSRLWPFILKASISIITLGRHTNRHLFLTWHFLSGPNICGICPFAGMFVTDNEIPTQD